MKIGIVSDIHCNIAGLDLALAQMGEIDELICAGDSIFQYRFSNEVADRLRERGARIIQGNHEDTFLSPGGVRARAAPWIDQGALAFLAEQPPTLTTIAGDKRLLVVHGSPWAPFSEYVYPHSRGMERFEELDADIIIMGHTHYQMAVRVGSKLLINPGSAGDPRDPGNGRRLSCAVLDTASQEVAFYDFANPARASAIA